MTFPRQILPAVLCLALGLCLAGCGRRGLPEAPQSSAADASVPAAPYAGLPRNNEIEPLDSAAISPPKGAAAAEASGPAKKPPRPFLLDPVL
ncbi:conserved hypothetical protein [Methylocella silvestris BL2]|uniref:Lipoprotein n=1 Tax=Methylocella silvestris (strain DSM 15510 / CIP 108128 / LMG 27833 / NCIMB 13906 / BL2) TaxID=395965 RepID=B8EMM0_METSB|nr:hypothetical protein [Methylocella silvestris]ACK52699.1 conserved hypothetical protein [Methylocella silvestris BL2]